MRCIFVIAAVTLASCMMPLSEDYPPINIRFSTLDEAWYWISRNVAYKRDWEVHGIIDEWQTPEQTYYRRTGDCEDIAGLLGYFAKEQGYRVYAIKTTMYNGAHMILQVGEEYLDPVVCGMRLKYGTFVIGGKWDYDTFIRLCHERGMR
jgi:hypothetical protein